jgi:hypothetical protein
VLRKCERLRMTRVFGFVFVLVTSLAHIGSRSTVAQEQILAEGSFPIETGSGQRLDSVGLILGVDRPGSALGEGYTRLLFDGFFWTNEDQGRIAFVDALTDEDFEYVTDFFTNGSNDRIWIGNIWHPGDGFSGYGAPESWLFFGDLNGTMSSDLHGFRISHIQMTLDQFHLNVPGHDPNGDGEWTDVRAEVTFTFFGAAVPEPASITLFLSAAVMMFLAQRLWQRSRS